MTPCCFLHGFLGSPSDWTAVLEAVEAASVRHAVTLPLADNWDAGLERLRAELPDEVILVGYSLGARVALGMALTYPEQIHGACLISGNPGLNESARAARRTADEAVAQRLLTEPLTEFLDRWYRQAVFASTHPATRSALIAEKQCLDRSYQANLLRCFSVSGQPDYWGQLAGISAPTMLVVGERDRKYLQIAESMKKKARQLQLHIVPGVGHAVHRERPRDLAKILNAFIATLQPEDARHD